MLRVSLNKKPFKGPRLRQMILLEGTKENRVGTCEGSCLALQAKQINDFFDKYLFITDSALEPNEATFDAVSLFPISSGSDIRGEL